MKRFIIIIISLLVITSEAWAQKNKADRQLSRYQYAKAIPHYVKYLKSKPDDYSVLKKLSYCYEVTNNINQATETYKLIVSLKESNSNDLFQLIQLLRKQQNISEAKMYALRYKNTIPGEKADNLLIALDSYSTLTEAANDYVVTDKTGKYAKSMYGGIKFRDKIIITAENHKSKRRKRSYTDLYITNTSFEKLTPFARQVMISTDDGCPAFTDSGNTMYYTSTYETFLKEGSVNIQKLKIATAILEAGKWKKGAELAYNSRLYNTVHPTISEDGNLLVFASDMPGGKGGMDLYMCNRQGGKWSQPLNLAALNTGEDEYFPVFNNNGDLTFSSNGWPGLGGLDLFQARKNANGFDTPVNLKVPFNSVFDDFYLFSGDSLNSGYLSSNRFSDQQTDHILYFEKVSKKPVTMPNTGLIVKVLDKYTRTPLPYVTVTIKDKSGQLFHQGLTDPEGQLILDELPKGEYSIKGMLNDVSTTSAKIIESDFKADSAIVKELYHNDPRFTLAGIAINTKSNEPLAGVLINCLNVNTEKSKKTTTGPDGKFLFQLEQNSDFEVQGQKQGWLSSEVADKTTKGLDRSQQLYVNLEMRIEQPVSKGTITLRKIHYDYDKCDIRPDAKIELNRLVKLLNDYPDMLIELSSHTDSRGSDDYNLKLSQCRADAAVNYLIKQGVLKNRLEAKGYGETKLLNRCINDAICTEDEHGENRRTEFTILSCPGCPK